MAMTDRQIEFIFRVKELLSLSSSASVKEREILNRAMISFNGIESFKKAINALSLDLRDLEKYHRNDVTPNVDKLFRDIQETYGEPVDYRGARNWQYDDLDFEWVAKGRYGGKWQRKDSEPESRYNVWSQLISVMVYIVVSIVVMALLVLLSSLL